jgi:pimeloyl-ACP methyl ester carboxylesterase
MGRFHAAVAPDPEPELDPYVLHAATSGSGPCAVLIHGVAGSNMIWDSIVPLLEPHFSVIRVDLLGYGRSPKPAVAHTPHRHVAAIRRTLAQRGFTPPYVLIGLSMGTNLMLEYAASLARRSSRRWSGSVSPSILRRRPPASAFGTTRGRGMALQPSRSLPASSFPSLWRDGAPGSRSVVSRNATHLYRGRWPRTPFGRATRSFRSSLLHCMVHYRLGDPLRASGEMRRLFIHGGDDQWAATDVVREALWPFPRTDFRVIERAPHNLAVAEPARTAALILDHVGSVARPEQ